MRCMLSSCLICSSFRSWSEHRGQRLDSCPDGYSSAAPCPGPRPRPPLANNYTRHLLWLCFQRAFFFYPGLRMKDAGWRTQDAGHARLNKQLPCASILPKSSAQSPLKGSPREGVKKGTKQGTERQKERERTNEAQRSL